MLRWALAALIPVLWVPGHSSDPSLLGALTLPRAPPLKFHVGVLTHHCWDKATAALNPTPQVLGCSSRMSLPGQCGHCPVPRSLEPYTYLKQTTTRVVLLLSCECTGARIETFTHILRLCYHHILLLQDSCHCCIPSEQHKSQW